MKEGKKDLRHLVRVANTDLPGSKRLLPALRKIKGVDFMFANMACALAGIDKTRITGSLSEEEAKKLEEVIKNPKKFNAPLWMLNRRNDYETGVDKHILLGDLDFTISNDIKRMRMTKSYKGLRHAAGLPVRGQRTKSNFRRNKGKVQGVKRKK